MRVLHGVPALATWEYLVRAGSQVADAVRLTQESKVAIRTSREKLTRLRPIQPAPQPREPRGAAIPTFGAGDLPRTPASDERWRLAHAIAGSLRSLGIACDVVGSADPPAVP